MTTTTSAEFRALPKKQRRANPEEQLHVAVAAYLRVAIRPPVIYTTLGHGGGGKARGARLKAMGLQPGWPDILIVRPIWPDGYYERAKRPIPVLIGLELKSKAGRQSPEQVALATAFEHAGGYYRLARSVEDVEAVLDELHVAKFAKAT